MQRFHYIPPAAKKSAALRVAAYCRVSSDSLDQLESYAAQLERYTGIIRQNPSWELAGIYADAGLTGTRADTRHDFQRLLKDCHSGKIDKILVKSISRFARNSFDCIASIRELKALGVEVFFEKEQIDTGSVASELMLSFFGAAAQEESMSISYNMRWSYKRRFKSGEFITCRAPYGYRLIKGDLVIDEGEAPIVRRIFDEYLAGKSTSEIAHKLAVEDIPKDGGSWTWKGINFILKNEKYAGNVLLQKRYKSDTLPFKDIWNKGERTMWFVENSHPAIVSRESFEQVQRLMSGRNVDVYPGKYPFSLMLYCDECGSSLKRRITNKKAYWVCRRHDRGKDLCPAHRVPEKELEYTFMLMHHKLAANRSFILTPMLEQFTTLRQRANLSQMRVAEIDNEILNIGRQGMLLHRIYGAKHIEAAYYYEQSNILNQQVNALRNERRLLIERSADDMCIEETETLIDLLEHSPDRLEVFDPALFKGMVKKATVSSQGVICFRLINGLEVTEGL